MLLSHAFGARYELPIPLGLFVLGGGLVVLASFLLILPRDVALCPEPEETDHAESQPLPPLRTTVSIAGLAFLIACGLTGSQESTDNLLPTLFWVLIWVAVPLLCGLFGDWTRSVNPFVALARLGNSPRSRRILLASPAPVRWPSWLGWWPAAGLFAAGVLGELVFNLSATVPRTLALTLFAYAVYCTFCGLLFGPAFVARGEMFAAVFGVWGRLGYWRFGQPGRRGFAGGLTIRFEPSSSRIVFVLLLLASVTFDGLLSTPRWNRLERRLPAAEQSLDVLKAFRTLSLGLLLLLIVGSLGMFALASSRAGRQPSGFAASLAGLLPSMLPIAFGYQLAHYAQYLVVNVQSLLPLLGNPPGAGWWPIHPPWPFDGSYQPDPRVLPTSFFWYFAVGVIVAAHVLAVRLAHRHLTRSAPAVALARRSEYPWLVAMVCYTMLSLWLLAQPLTTEQPSRPPTVAPARAVVAVGLTA